MHETLTSFHLAPVLINLPKYAILIIAVPMLTVSVLKVWLTAHASSKEKPRKEWVLSRQLDKEGIPLLAETPATRAGRQRITMPGTRRR